MTTRGAASSRPVASSSRGWRLPFRIDRDGRLQVERREELAETIRLILEVAPGERPLLPEFGCRVHALKSVENSRDRQIAAALAEEALLRWAPRLGVSRVEVIDVAPPRVRFSVRAGQREAEVWIRCHSLEWRGGSPAQEGGAS